MTTLMPVSQRVSQLAPSATLAVTARVRELKAAGEHIIGFGVGEPDFDTPAVIKTAAIEALQSGMTSYGPVPGAIEAREAIAGKLRTENGIACTADDIVVSVGGKHSLYLALHCLLDIGANQQVIVPTPAWVSYRPMIELAGGVVVEVAGAIENDFRITPEQLRDAITPRTSIVMLNSPSNPCGTMYTPDDLHAICDVVAQHDDIVIISDEIYEKLIFGGIEHFSPGSRADLAERVITVNGLSKAYAMTGWRIGYACAPAGLAKQMSKLQGQMTSGITSFCNPAIVAALTRAADDVERMRSAFAERATLIRRLIDDWPDVICPTPTGAFYVFPDMRAYIGRTSTGGATMDRATALATALLEEAKVAVVPGEDFGACARTHIRLSFATSEDDIREGCERIRRFLADVP